VVASLVLEAHLRDPGVVDLGVVVLEHTGLGEDGTSHLGRGRDGGHGGDLRRRGGECDADGGGGDGKKSDLHGQVVLLICFISEILSIRKRVWYSCHSGLGHGRYLCIICSFFFY